MFENNQHKIIGGFFGTAGGVTKFVLADISPIQTRVLDAVLIAVICALASAIAVDLYKTAKKWIRTRYFSKQQ